MKRSITVPSQLTVSSLCTVGLFTDLSQTLYSERIICVLSSGSVGNFPFFDPHTRALISDTLIFFLSTVSLGLSICVACLSRCMHLKYLEQ